VYHIVYIVVIQYDSSVHKHGKKIVGTPFIMWVVVGTTPEMMITSASPRFSGRRPSNQRNESVWCKTSWIT
jgi:hypothetical protein